MVRDWEAAAEPAREAGIRVVNPRFGIVQSAAGGALRAQLPLFRLGLGGRVGSGRQYVSWVAIDDVVRAIEHALSSDRLSGPVNVTAPEPVTNADYARTLGRVLRPTCPAAGARAGGAACAGRVRGGAAGRASGWWPTGCRRADSNSSTRELEGALRHVLGRPA